MFLDSSLQSLLQEILEWGQAYDATEAVPNRRMRNLKPETAQMVSILVRASRRHRILEIGTSSGYSTIWLGACARDLGGQVTSIDHSVEKHALAKENLRKADLLDWVDLHTGDATELVQTLDATFDCVFFDSVQVQPWRQLEVLLPKLAPNVLIMADNVLSHGEEMAPFLDLLKAQSDIDFTVAPIGKGLCVAHRLEEYAYIPC